MQLKHVRSDLQLKEHAVHIKQLTDLFFFF